MLYTNKMPSTHSWAIDMDLHQDVDNYYYNKLASIGFISTRSKNYAYEYFKYLHKLLPIRKRKIIKAKEFSCPEACVKALKSIENDILLGRNLNIYLSKNILDPSSNDGLLNDWGIHHLHLSERSTVQNGFVTRSDYQLFIFFTDDTAYLLQIYPHKKKHLYSTQALIKIVHQNWPELISRYHYDGAFSIEPILNDAEYAKVRKANGLVLIETEKNYVYFPPGGGYASDGSSISVVSYVDFMLNRLTDAEDFFIFCFPVMMNRLKTTYPLLKFPLKITWLGSDSKDDVFILFEQTNNLTIQLDLPRNAIWFCNPYDFIFCNPVQPLFNQNIIIKSILKQALQL